MVSKDEYKSSKRIHAPNAIKMTPMLSRVSDRMSGPVDCDGEQKHEQSRQSKQNQRSLTVREWYLLFLSLCLAHTKVSPGHWSGMCVRGALSDLHSKAFVSGTHGRSA